MLHGSAGGSAFGSVLTENSIDMAERPWSFEKTQTRTTKEQADVQAAVLREFDAVEADLGDDRFSRLRTTHEK